ncbi:hypothetical protein D6T69_06805 [Tenacibaculum singaporense]|uniref:Capsule assembly protein Wzi n=1 Tax=Tenacibaculum singaporense TaxID=2358479 RepID=A0A3Q8RS61_9FLAO|nr:hypothetical protein [Tenacibaculum singaporense]AZJ35243.1 hypothetical protein D6T69_06805 [Tenacibaculum singaporense]
MKKITFLILLFSISTFSQNISQTQVDSIIKNHKENDKRTKYQTHIDDYIKTHYKDKNKVVSNTILGKKLNKYFNQAIFGNSDISTNSSALGLAIKNNETSINLNTILALSSPGKNQWFLKPGIFTEGKSSLFNLYSEGSWSNNVGINLGVVYKFKGSMSFYSTSKTKHIDNRKYFVDSILSQKRSFVKLYHKVNPSKKIAVLDTIVSIRRKGVVNYEKFESIVEKGHENHIKEADFVALLKRINSKGAKFVKDSLSLVNSNYKNFSECNQKNLVSKEFQEYDNKFQGSGYSFKWIAFDNSFSNHVYKIDSLNILKDLNIEEFDNKFKWESSINYNYLRKRNSLVYIQTGFSLVAGNLLDNNLILKTPRLKNDSGNLIITDTEDNEIGNYNNLNDDSYFGNFNFYGLYAFSGYNKMGLSLNFSHNFLMGNKNDNPYFQKNFTLLFGPVFRDIKKDGVNKVTIGIEAGFENAIYNSKISDDFIARIRVGIPIKALF